MDSANARYGCIKNAVPNEALPPSCVVPKTNSWGPNAMPPVGSSPSAPPVKLHNMLSVQGSPSAAGGVNENTVPKSLPIPPVRVVPNSTPLLPIPTGELGDAPSFDPEPVKL